MFLLFILEDKLSIYCMVLAALSTTLDGKWLHLSQTTVSASVCLGLMFWLIEWAFHWSADNAFAFYTCPELAFGRWCTKFVTTARILGGVILVHHVSTELRMNELWLVPHDYNKCKWEAMPKWQCWPQFGACMSAPHSKYGFPHMQCSELLWADISVQQQWFEIYFTFTSI